MTETDSRRDAERARLQNYHDFFRYLETQSGATREGIERARSRYAVGDVPLPEELSEIAGISTKTARRTINRVYGL